VRAKKAWYMVFLNFKKTIYQAFLALTSEHSACVVSMAALLEREEREERKGNEGY
jgi:hypothetical protein